MARYSSKLGLLPSPADLLEPGRRPDPQLRIHPTGPYANYNELLETHIELLTEDLILALREQVEDLQRNPHLLRRDNCYSVEGYDIRMSMRDGGKFRSEDPVGIEFAFNTTQYESTNWDEDRRFLTGNLVFITDNDMEDFVLGIVHDSEPRLLSTGRVVIKLVRGVDLKGRFSLLDHMPYLGRRCKLIESDTFYFPYLHVTNALRKDVQDNSRTLLFESEIVECQFPSKWPRYAANVLNAGSAGSAGQLLDQFHQELNTSQMAAFKSALRRRVALVQGPPGTGKTFLGCKLAQYFVELKKDQRFKKILGGPILVVTTTNHAVHEFLTRCSSFSDKLLHGYSTHHKQSSYGKLQERYDECQRSSARFQLMGEADILAMTTTRATFIRTKLDQLRIKIMIVEEAGEVPEAYILASIPQGTEHIIQIGDHKQLRPSCAFQPLASTHHLDLSLFERLINNGAECIMLNEQRRMRPAVADLVRPLYPGLTDHPTTRARSSLAGVDLAEPVFFLTHSEMEVPDGKGFSNKWEAEMAAELATYLVEQGLPGKEITILATYRRQLLLIMDCMDRIGKVTCGIRTTTVDNFQGEENSVIILSLVRSNVKGSVGFLNLENRACVALSRAKDGLFLLGNAGCLAASAAPLWQHVQSVLSEAGRAGPALPLLVRGQRVMAHSAADVRRARKLAADLGTREVVMAEAAPNIPGQQSADATQPRGRGRGRGRGCRPPDAQATL